MSKELILASLGFSFFVICPRMAGIVHIISRHAQVPVMTTAVLGTLIALPLIMLMVAVFGRWGVTGALIFCVATDLGAALMMGGLSLKAGVETLVVALFVIAGVKVAPLLTSLLKLG